MPTFANLKQLVAHVRANPNVRKLTLPREERSRLLGEFLAMHDERAFMLGRYNPDNGSWRLMWGLHAQDCTRIESEGAAFVVEPEIHTPPPLVFKRKRRLK